MRVVKTDEAMKTGLPEWALAMPLGGPLDESVLRFLERAEAAGARYVSDVNIVFAARKDGQLLECRTHVQPVLTLERRMSRAVMASVPESQSPMNYLAPCKGRNCSSGSTPMPVAVRYVYRPVADVPSFGLVATWPRWRLQKSDPECTLLEGGEASLASRFQRVEGHAYGCGDASASGCEDRIL
ncbi:hypothetical protein DAT35_16315 [Vitiosangium sp. GDMCC 1.1324]|nr:hypothetical protein DAT35_16315 [Vitiosangium sp. GDMCC 1.1324]